MTDGEAGKDVLGRDSEQVKKDLIADHTTPTAATASGLAALGSPKGENIAKDPEGVNPGEGDAIRPGAGPIGQQAEAAFFTRNGSIPANTIPSPSGPVPASVIADKETRERAIKAAREGARTSRRRVSDELAARMSPAELRAVAHDRGYEGVEGGRSAVLRKFLDAQKKDESLDDDLGVEPVVPAVPGVGATASGNPLMTPSAPGGLQTPAGTLRNTDGSTPEKK